MRELKLNSIHSRFLVLSILLIAALMIAAFTGEREASKSQQTASAGLQQRVNLIEQVRSLRIAMLGAYQDLNAFLHQPENNLYRQSANNNIIKAIDISNSLIIVYDNDQALIGQAKKINDALKVFQKNMEDLFVARSDVFRLFPSMAESNKTLRPNRRDLNNAFANIFFQLNEDQTLKHQPIIYQQIVNVRDSWRQVNSIFRLYLANRIGSFNVDRLNAQEQAIETFLDDIAIRLKVLIAQQDMVSFEILNELETAKIKVEAWHTGFKKVKKIHQSNNWRTDVVLMKENIVPLIDQISMLLNRFDFSLDKSTSSAIEQLQYSTEWQNKLLWGVAMLGGFFILIVLLSIERMILKPVEQVARAMKTQAFGKESIKLPPVKYIETQILCDSFSQMNKQIVLRQNDLEYQATHDGLTSLPNRVLLDDRIDYAIHQASRSRSKFSLMLIDMDNFKEVNDTLGHHIGDALLQDVSNRLLNVLRDIDTVARLGGDEFAILIQDCDQNQVITVAEKIQQSFESSVIINELQLYISASIGIAVYPDHGQDGHNLLRLADIAMYRAKQNHHEYIVYNEADDEYSMQRLSLISDLRIGLEQHHLSLAYQPKLNLKNSQITGVEALLRWQHEKYGNISPEEIISLAEQSGQIKSLTKWVIREAIKQRFKWESEGIDLNISVNLSVYNIKDKDLVGYVRMLLDKYDMNAESLCLEITESAMMSNPLHAIETLTEFSEMGVSLAIDDFGTGFSSLSYIKQLPVNEIKIDKSFVINMEHDADDEVIVKSTIDLVHNLGLKVTAEGVENEFSWLHLRKMGCDEVQGYFMSQAMSGNDIGNWISQWEEKSLVISH